MVTTDFLLILLAGFGIFLVIRQLVLWLQQSLLYGPLNGFYRKYLQTRSSARFTLAIERNDADQAWNQVVKKKIRELGIGFSIEKRLLAVEHLEREPPSREIADGLVKALQLPHSDRLDVKMKMACLLCKVLTALSSGDVDRAAPPDGLDKMARSWNMTLSIWITLLLWAMVVWGRLAQLPMKPFLFLAGVVFVVTTLSLTQVARGWVALLNALVLGFAVAVGGVWLYTESTHSGQETKTFALDEYGFPGLTVTVDYPKWITADDLGSKGQRVVAFWSGGTIPDISFVWDNTVVYTTDQKGNLMTPMIHGSGVHDSPFEFFVQPKNQQVLKGKATAVTLSIAANPQSRLIPIPELSHTILLEDPVWKAVRDICRTLSGSATGLAFALYLISKVINMLTGKSGKLAFFS